MDEFRHEEIIAEKYSIQAQLRAKTIEFENLKKAQRSMKSLLEIPAIDDAARVTFERVLLKTSKQLADLDEELKLLRDILV